MTPDGVAREALQRDLRDAEDRAAMLRALADAEHSPELSELWRRAAERPQAIADDLAGRLGPDADRRPSRRARLLVQVTRRAGTGVGLPLVTRRMRARASPQDQLAARSRMLNTLAQVAPEGVDGATIARLDARHKSGGGNALRAAVLGANDGLVSNLALVMGVAGANLGEREILVTGLAGLLAGACSMAMGEWVSVQSSRELYVNELNIERREIAEHPDAERAELALIYRAKGLTAEQSDHLAARIMEDPDRALDAMAREELGIDPEGLGGSPWQAAIASFGLFFVGALPPVLPFALLGKHEAIAVSLALSGVMLFLIGASITVFTGRSWPASGARQLAFGLGAAAVTFGIGRLIGVSVA